jgi:hypothetical protein
LVVFFGLVDYEVTYVQSFQQFIGVQLMFGASAGAAAAHGGMAGVRGPCPPS